MTRRIAVIGDVHYSLTNSLHGEDRKLFYHGLLDVFFSTKADLHVALGDISHNGTHEEWEEFISLAKHLAAKHNCNFQLIIGNHDTLHYTKSEIVALTKQPLYSMIEWQDLRIILLDTTKECSPLDWGGEIDEVQLQWLRSLRTHPSKVTAIFAHHPFPNTTSGSHEVMMSLAEPYKIYSELSQSNCRVIYINGHNHTHSVFADATLWPKWTFVQAASILSSPSFLLIDIALGQFRSSTIVIDDPAIHSAAYRLRHDMSHYHHPSI
ncbi:MAG: metallophosphoesterase [Acidibacillus sp.]|nr:metallophosphoesterase [Acidibacillus sp.]